MIIKKDSWHYRLLDFFGDSPWEWGYHGSFGLCLYCRRVFLALFKAFVLCLILLMPLSIVAIYIAFCFGYAISDEPVALASFGAVIIAFSAFIGINGCWGDLIKEKESAFLQRISIKKSYERKPKKAKEPGLIRVWLKAVHDKVCPSITLEK